MQARLSYVAIGSLHAYTSKRLLARPVPAHLTELCYVHASFVQFLHDF